MTYLAGAPLTLTLMLKDALGVPITNASLLFPHTRGTNGVSYVPTWAHTGGGVYTITTPSTALTVWGYAELWVRATTTPFQDFYTTISVVTPTEPLDVYTTRPVSALMVVLDASQNGVSVVTWSVEVARKPDGTSFAGDVTVTKRQDGAFVATFTPTQAGPHYLRLKTTNLNPAQTFEGTFDANTLSVASVIGRRPILSRVRLDDPGAPSQIIRGDTVEWEWTIVDQTGAAFDLAGCTLWWTGKRAATDPDATAELKHYWVSGGASSGLVVSAPASGKVRQTIPATVTDLYDPATLKQMVFDVQILFDSVKVRTMEKGSLSITDDLTRRVITP